MLSFNQLSHACPLQEENILLHFCNLQGLHHPEPENGITILAALWSALKRNKSQTYNSTLSYIPTYKDEPSAHGRCELEARRSVHPERM